jgi:hypothetical protein
MHIEPNSLDVHEIKMKRSLLASNLPGLPLFSRREIEDLVELIHGQDNKAPASACCECGHVLDAATGKGAPKAGDLSLCVYRGSLNVFDDGLRLRKPTDEEYFAAAADRKIQNLRIAINETARRRKEAGERK